MPYKTTYIYFDHSEFLNDFFLIRKKYQFKFQINWWKNEILWDWEVWD